VKGSKRCAEISPPAKSIQRLLTTVAWHCGNKDECNREEGNRRYPSHFSLTDV